MNSATKVQGILKAYTLNSLKSLPHSRCPHSHNFSYVIKHGLDISKGWTRMN